MCLGSSRVALLNHRSHTCGQADARATVLHKSRASDKLDAWTRTEIASVCNPEDVVTNLRHIEEALAGLTDAEIRALKVASNEAPQAAPGILAWMEGACEWELDRRHGFHYTLRPPKAQIDPSEDAVSIDATYAMRASFAAGDQDNGALTLLDALVELLTGSTNTH